LNDYNVRTLKFVRCVPHSLTKEQKACKMKWCQEVMRKKLYENEAPRHLNNFITNDETWLHYYVILLRSKSNNQVCEDESTLTQM